MSTTAFLRNSLVTLPAPAISLRVIILDPLTFSLGTQLMFVHQSGPQTTYIYTYFVYMYSCGFICTKEKHSWAGKGAILRCAMVRDTLAISEGHDSVYLLSAFMIVVLIHVHTTATAHNVLKFILSTAVSQTCTVYHDYAQGPLHVQCLLHSLVQ